MSDIKFAGEGAADISGSSFKEDKGFGGSTEGPVEFADNNDGARGFKTEWGNEKMPSGASFQFADEG